MEFREMVLKNRSYRRFDESFEVSEETLKELVDLARLTPSAANAQVLKYKISADTRLNERIFPNLKWAAALPDWDGPKEGERPRGYIIILSDLSIGKEHKQDEGIAAQTIMLGAAERGLGGCIMGAIDRERLYDVLEIDKEKYSIELVLAIGKPAENVEITEIEKDGSTKYYRKDGIHFVPKRKLEDILI